MSLDFYLPDYNVAIECQGIQHFKVIQIRGESKAQAEKKFKEQCIRDKRKKILCKKNNIKLFYINYDENENNKLELIINKCKMYYEKNRVD